MHCRLWASSSCFLLVTALSRRHLALAALPPPLARSPSSSEEPSAAHYSVVWSSPAAGDRFGPGDTIVGEWQVTPHKVVSPSFRLCVGAEDGCGATVWPEVVEESEGSYFASLTAPSVNTESGYYLQMKDDFGHTFSSPIFNITPTPQKKNKPAAHPPDVAQPQPDQAPMSSSSSSSSTDTKSKGATDSNPAPAADPNGILSPPSPASSRDPNSAAAASTPTGSNSSSSSGSGSGGPQVAAAHNAPPTAALAVPLSLAGAIILLAGGLALHHRRRLAAERERSWSRSRGNRHDCDVDVEKVLFARALFRGEAPLPDAYAHDAYYGDRLLREKTAADGSYSPSSCAPTPSYAYRAPEPRQRTRGLDLFPRREFTTARPRAYHSSSLSSSSSSYRGLWARRHSVLRRDVSTNDGGGSLWRSLSFAAAAPARHKKVAAPVAPVAPPSALNSPAMTAVTSVTSDVLPSYLPSPNFVDDRARGGDFGFENVPLSPPLPSPLHTRGEATDPDDSRMRELRGVYEAVSRALGNMPGV